MMPCSVIVQRPTGTLTYSEFMALVKKYVISLNATYYPYWTYHPYEEETWFVGVPLKGATVMLSLGKPIDDDQMVYGFYGHSTHGHHKWVRMKAPPTLDDMWHYLMIPFCYDPPEFSNNLMMAPFGHFKREIDMQVRLGYECKVLY